MSDLDEIAKKVTNRDKFVHFIEVMSSDLETNGKLWENNDLASFLEAFGRWVADMDGYYINQELDQPKDINWQFMADAFMAATVYE